MTSEMSSKRSAVRVAVWGCGHGTLDRVYETIAELEKNGGGIGAAAAGAGSESKSETSLPHPSSATVPSAPRKVDLLICCGDFQAVRNEHDMECMACPSKYRCMQDFYQYYSGEKRAPVLTIFIGGNHEAANHLQELPYGGWVAPNIYYLGQSGVVRFGGLRIAGVSGIYKRYDYRTGYHERAPYDDDTARSVFHMREFDTWKLSQLAGSPLDVMITHDWPEGIYRHGDVHGLLRKKKHFAAEVQAGELGNPETSKLLPVLKPKFWFSAHLHVKFTAIVQHNATPSGASSSSSSSSSSAAPSAVASASASDKAESTYFLALDKCVPGRSFLQVLDLQPSVEDGGASGDSELLQLEYDPQWLAILRKTHSLTPLVKRYDGSVSSSFPPASAVIPSQKEADEARALAAAALGGSGSLAIPLNWQKTVEPYAPPFPGAQYKPARRVPQAHQIGNPQHDALLSILGGLPHLTTIPWKEGQKQVPEGAVSGAGTPSAAAAGGAGGYGGGQRFQGRSYQQQQQHHHHLQQQYPAGMPMHQMHQIPPMGMQMQGFPPFGPGMMMAPGALSYPPYGHPYGHMPAAPHAHPHGHQRLVPSSVVGSLITQYQQQRGSSSSSSGTGIGGLAFEPEAAPAAKRPADSDAHDEEEKDNGFSFVPASAAAVAAPGSTSLEAALPDTGSAATSGPAVAAAVGTVVGGTAEGNGKAKDPSEISLDDL
jgi:lariat debranching enzyme